MPYTLRISILPFANWALAIGGKPFPVSIATLYNAINLFMQLKLVECHKLHTTTVYEASYGNGNVIRQICRVCGKEQEVKAIRHLLKTSG